MAGEEMKAGSVRRAGRGGGDQYVPAHLNRLQQVWGCVAALFQRREGGGSWSPEPEPLLGAGGRGGHMPLHFGGLCKLPRLPRGLIQEEGPASAPLPILPISPVF